MVARRSGRGYEPADDRNTSYRRYSRSSREGSRYGTRQRGMVTPRASRIDGRTRPSTHRSYRDTFYEDLLTDGVFESPLDAAKEESYEEYDDYAERKSSRRSLFSRRSRSVEVVYDYDDYEDDDEDDYPEEAPYTSRSRASYSRDRYGSGARSSTRAVGSRDRSSVESSDHDDRDELASESRGSYRSRSTYSSAEQGGYGGSHASRYSSLHSADRYRRPASKRNGIGKKQIILAVLVLVVVLIGGGIFSYVNGISSNLQRGVDDDLRNALVKTDMANEPFYMLLLGTDGSLERETSGEFNGNYRSDSIMLVRIDPVDKKVALISISRDIMVDLGEYGEQKLNAAYGFGGPALAVQAVSKLTGVDISHYAQVDFDGFSELVDALGGVTVNVPIEIDDWEAGGYVAAGEQVLDGEKALILCRSRNTYAETASQPDAMRAANQRLVMSAIAHKLLDADIATIASSVQALSSFVTTDLSIMDIIGLAQTMKGLDSTTDIYTAMAPTKSQMVKDISVDYVDREAWNKMMKRFQEGLPPTEEAEIDEITGTVLASVGSDVDISVGSKYANVIVKNGTERQGLANQTRNVLLSYGFKNVVIGDVNPNYEYPQTLIVYEKDNAEYGAQQLAKIMEQGKVIQNKGQYLMPDAEFLIIIGDDWV